MELQLTLLAVIALALFFDFTNGFHDAANALTPLPGGTLIVFAIAVLVSAGIGLLARAHSDTPRPAPSPAPVTRQPQEAA